jgi:hypothetical protein
MKKVSLLALFAFTLFSCSKEKIEIKQIPEPTCYDIVTWADDPSGDYITIRISAYEYKNFKVKDYRDYLGKTQICDLTTIK